MRRITIIAAAAVMLLAPLAANARDWRYRDGEPRGWGRFDRVRDDDRDDRGRERDDRGRDRYDRGRERDDRGRDDERARRRYEPDPELRRREDPRNAPPPYLIAPAGRNGQAWRQGQYLPPMYRGGVVRDPGRYRLRAPPPGYDWIGVGPNIYLMQRGSGLILDAIPGGY